MCGCCSKNKEDEDLENQLPEQPCSGRKKVCCTDIPCLLLIILFFGGIGVVTVFAVMNGNPFRLLYGYDCYGNTCNSQNRKTIANESLNGLDLRGKAYLFFYYLPDIRQGLQLCVQDCPRRDLNTIEDVRLLANDSGIDLCRYDFNSSAYYFKNESGSLGPCPPVPIAGSFSLLGRCIPANMSGFDRNYQRNIIGAVNEMDVFEQVLKDFYTSYKEILILCLIAAAFSFMMVLLIRFLAAVVIYLIIIFFLLGSLAGCVFMWWTFVNAYMEGTKKVEIEFPLLDSEINNEFSFLGLAIIGTVLTIIFFVLIIAMSKRLQFVKDLFGAAGRCITAAPMVLFQPIWTYLILIIFFAFWSIVLAFIVTAGVPTKDSKYACYTFHKVGPLQYLWYYHLAALIWVSEFVLACQQLVIAGVVAQWYFCRKRADLPSFPVHQSCSRVILHHLGTAAFGSLIITLVKLPRWILMWLKKKWQHSIEDGGLCSPVSSFCLRCCICCLWCLECCLRYLTHNAYAVTMIRGSSFCPAARRAFSILLSNSLRVAALNSVGDFVLLLGKIGICSATTALAVVILKTRDDLHFYMVPVVAVSIFSFFIAHCFLSVYEIVMDVLLVCYCEDRRINDGTPGREYFMTTDLHRLMEKNSAKLTAATRPPRTKKRQRTEQPDGIALTSTQPPAPAGDEPGAPTEQDPAVEDGNRGGEEGDERLWQTD